MNRAAHYLLIAAPLVIALGSSPGPAMAKWENEYGSADSACRARINEDGDVEHAGTRAQDSRVSQCLCRMETGDDKRTWECNTVVNYDDTEEEKEPPKPEEPSSPKNKGDICKVIATTFDETLFKGTVELPAKALVKGVVAMGVIIAADDSEDWVAGISNRKGAEGQNFDVYPSGAPSATKDDYFAHGIAQGEPSNVQKCKAPSTRFVYAKSGRPLEGHAEAKIIEDWYRHGVKPGSTLYLEIRGRKQDPCAGCSDLIKFVNDGSAGDCPRIQICPSTDKGMIYAP